MATALALQTIRLIGKKVSKEVVKKIAKNIAKGAGKAFAKNVAKQGAKKLGQDMGKQLAKRFVMYSWPQMLAMGVIINGKVGEKAAEDYIERKMPFSWFDFIPLYGEAVLLTQILDLATSNDELEKEVENAITDDLTTQILKLPIEKPGGDGTSDSTKDDSAPFLGISDPYRVPYGKYDFLNAIDDTSYSSKDVTKDDTTDSDKDSTSPPSMGISDPYRVPYGKYDFLRVERPGPPVDPLVNPLAGGGSAGGHQNATNHSGGANASGSSDQPTLGEGWDKKFENHNDMQDYVKKLRKDWKTDGSKGNWVVLFSVERNHPSRGQNVVPVNSRRVKIIVVAGPLAIPKINVQWFKEPAYQCVSLGDIPWRGDGHKDKPGVDAILDSVNNEIERIIRRGPARDCGPPRNLASLGGNMKLTFQRNGNLYGIGGKRAHFFEMP